MIKKFNEMKKEPYPDEITISFEDLKIFVNTKKNPKYPDLHFEYDLQGGGSYDTEKGSLEDFPLSLYDIETDDEWTANGGYYNSAVGVIFGDGQKRKNPNGITFHKIKYESEPTKPTNTRTVEIVKVWYSIRNCGDGSAYPYWFLTEEESEWDQDNQWEGWGETCNGSVETFVGSDIYKTACEMSKKQKLSRQKK
jgi:hypothetical protein